MGYLSIGRAVAVRLLFASHGIISVWRLYLVTRDKRCWYLASALGLLLIEATITLGKRQGKEWKWFCPSVFIYLLSSVPAIWFLELYEFEQRIRYHAIKRGNITYDDDDEADDMDRQKAEDLSTQLGSVLGVHFEIRIPVKLTPDQWIRTLEQLLLLILILGRWLLPKGKLTHDQLSQLLLVYIGTAADIVEFFEAFKEREVRYNRVLCMVILGLWSLSLLQFSLVLTAARARRDRSGVLPTEGKPLRKYQCCGADVFGIMISILIQDLPFLVLRMFLIFKYNVVSYTNMFFTSKNTLVIVLLFYRLIVVFIERRLRHTKDTPEFPRTPTPEKEEIPLKEIETSEDITERDSKLLMPYPVESSFPVMNGFPGRSQSLPRIYQLRQDRHKKYGRAYHFEEVL